ncbi:MAG: adenylate/guanylate cyclase domain-containing protein [Burkholderiales bacterium]
MAATKSTAPKPERVAAVILFAETSGFTRTSAMLEPDVVLARAAEFFALVRTAVETHGGVVRSALNDTLMASFTGADRARQAVAAAQDIQREFTAIEESWQQDYGIRAAVSIGLHAGDVVVGVADPALPVQPLIVGDSVSVAERLLHRARAGEMVLSKPVMDAYAAGGIVLEAEELPALAIPRRDPIRLFGVLRDTRLDFT